MFTRVNIPNQNSTSMTVWPMSRSCQSRSCCLLGVLEIVIDSVMDPTFHVTTSHTASCVLKMTFCDRIFVSLEQTVVAKGVWRMLQTCIFFKVICGTFVIFELWSQHVSFAQWTFVTHTIILTGAFRKFQAKKHITLCLRLSFSCLEHCVLAAGRTEQALLHVSQNNAVAFDAWSICTRSNLLASVSHMLQLCVCLCVTKTLVRRW